MYEKPIRVFLKGQAKERYAELLKKHDKRSRSLLHAIERIFDILKRDPQYGQPVPKYLIPPELLKEGITNLYRVELPQYWRMVYTIEGDAVKILVFVMRIHTHREYDRFFGYK